MAGSSKGSTLVGCKVGQWRVSWLYPSRFFSASSIVNGIDNHRRNDTDAGLGHRFGAEWSRSFRTLDQGGGQRRQIPDIRQIVVAETHGPRFPVVEKDFFHKSVTQALYHASVELSLVDQRIHDVGHIVNEVKVIDFDGMLAAN